MASSPAPGVSWLAIAGRTGLGDEVQSKNMNSRAVGGGTAASAEINFARRLAATDPKKRRAAVKGLNDWLRARAQAAEAGMLPVLEVRKLWRGLFFCMWLADKEPVQADLAAKLGALVHAFDAPGAVHVWVTVLGRTLREEWGKIDKYRVDKFYVLIRHALREVFGWLAAREWSEALVAVVSDALHEGLLQHPRPNGIRLHVADVLLDEVFAAVQRGSDGFDTDVLMLLLEPVFEELASTGDRAFFQRATTAVVLGLLVQDSSATADIELPLVRERIFELASSPETRDRHRTELYEAHKAFQRATADAVLATGMEVDGEAEPEPEAEAVEPARKRKSTAVTEAVPTTEAPTPSKGRKRPKVGTRSPAPDSNEQAADEAASKPKKKLKNKAKAAPTTPTSAEDDGAVLPVKKRVSFGKAMKRGHIESTRALKRSQITMDATPTRGLLKKQGGDCPRASPRPRASDYF